jgi:uncharacterized membrane protein YkoI
MMRITLAVICMTIAFGTGGYGAQSTTTSTAKAAPPKTTAAATTDSKVALKDLPPEVRATVETETKNAVLKGVSKEKEKGKTVYEVESLVNGRTRDLMIDASGKVYVVEEQLNPDQAPALVRAALEAKGTILTLESVLENGTTTYEGQVKSKSGKKITMELDAAGKPVKK